MANIGKIVYFHRKKSGLSRIELAEIADVGKTLIYDIENGKENVKYSYLLKVLKALNIKISFQSPLMEQFSEGANEKG